MQAAERVETSYLCGSCGVKVEAITRQQRIKAVPPFLALQLQRFVYDMQVWVNPLFAFEHDNEFAPL